MIRKHASLLTLLTLLLLLGLAGCRARDVVVRPEAVAERNTGWEISSEPGSSARADTP